MYPLFPGKHVVGSDHGVPWLFSLFPGEHVVGHGYHQVSRLFSLFSGKHAVGSGYDGVPWLFSLFHRKRVDGSGYHRSIPIVSVASTGPLDLELGMQQKDLFHRFLI